MPMLSKATVLESIVLDNDCRVLPCHSVISGLSLSTCTFISAVKMRDEKAPAPLELWQMETQLVVTCPTK